MKFPKQAELPCKIPFLFQHDELSYDAQVMRKSSTNGPMWKVGTIIEELSGAEGQVPTEHMIEPPVVQVVRRTRQPLTRVLPTCR